MIWSGNLFWSAAAFEWLGRIEHELLLFAAVWFAIGAIDEFAVDVLYLWLRLTARVQTLRLQPRAILAQAGVKAREVARTVPLAAGHPPRWVREPAPFDHPAFADGGFDGAAPLRGLAAVLVPAWREAAVVSSMLRHALKSWPQAELRIYAGCYRNDPATLTAMIAAAHGDHRIRIVIVNRDGPTTKADCLNRLYQALCEDERRMGRARSVILHDAEDMVHPAALALMDATLDDADFVQLPVRAEPQDSSPWIAGHYCDEFAESHGKAMVVRDWLGTGLPAAGVGCAFRRETVDQITRERGAAEPFAAECLTEDYECGLLIEEIGGVARFVRARDSDGSLVATREFFPGRLAAAVRQKTRWQHGIALQGWDRMGWRWRGSQQPLAELWMRLRDRRGPFTAVVLACAYLLIAIWPLLALAEWGGLYQPQPIAPLLQALLKVNFAALGWRVAWRVAFTTREYGLVQGIMSVIRMPVANVIAIMAGRRAMVAYLVSLRNGKVKWEHTVHTRHPAAEALAAEDGTRRLAKHERWLKEFGRFRQEQEPAHRTHAAISGEVQPGVSGESLGLCP
ncbi:glycosyl transferase family protein [Novosphingobium cyanobacteriorum]|uniref:Glycosyl transferase family protein n=1 Tax=Novosphingobium cyanobacteriorum TaxID=3024215 RepID=A0ABT6CG03_9SPHN|nr:glycosyl transferase family protein [Novosphingobium cyanobacteriorum]MDF8332716.1 glycosyl transferase family protein [Novosphingobium cyanobacteriorum]